MKMTKTCRRWWWRCGAGSRWCSAKLMDSLAAAADEEPAEASISADSHTHTQPKKKRKKEAHEEEPGYHRVSAGHCASTQHRQIRRK